MCLSLTSHARTRISDFEFLAIRPGAVSSVGKNPHKENPAEGGAAIQHSMLN